MENLMPCKIQNRNVVTKLVTSHGTTEGQFGFQTKINHCSTSRVVPVDITGQKKGNKGFPKTSMALFRMPEHPGPHFAAPHQVLRGVCCSRALAFKAPAAHPLIT